MCNQAANRAGSLVKAFSLVCRWLSLHCVLTWIREIISHLSFLVRTLILFKGASTLITFQKTPLLNTTILGIRTSTGEFGGGVYTFSPWHMKLDLGLLGTRRMYWPGFQHAQKHSTYMHYSNMVALSFLF